MRGFRLAALPLLLLRPCAGAAKPCDSGAADDVKESSCESWCDKEYASDHCLMCKCNGCDFCSGFDLTQIKKEREEKAKRDAEREEELFAERQKEAEAKYAEELKWREEEEARQEKERLQEEALAAQKQAQPR